MLTELKLRDVGPAQAFEVEFAERLNIFTGDNGLGKTFLLDVCWWVLTGLWVDEPPTPQRGDHKAPQIKCFSNNGSGRLGQPNFEANFDQSLQSWVSFPAGPIESGLVIYARIDGGFSVWDFTKNFRMRMGSGSDFRQTVDRDAVKPPVAYHFSRETLRDGLESGERVLSNGLIRDWVSWQFKPDQAEDAPFQILKRVIKKLSHPTEVIEPGPPIRTSIYEARDIPTLQLPYGLVPVTLASAGMMRIISLAYLIVWTWHEHLQASKILGLEPVDRLVFLMDEVESHLHPRWQRTILPALMEVASILDSQMATQLILTTHSPMVLSSIEPDFDPDSDKLFLFDIAQGQVTLNEVPWAKQGDATSWLTSGVFGLAQARSKEAEVAIEAAEAFMRHDEAALPEGLKTKEQIHEELTRVLPGHDPFWPRWVVKGYERTP